MKDKFEAVYPSDPSSLKLRGFWTATVRGEDGQIKQQVAGTNVVTTAGKEFLASFLVSAAAAASTFTCKYIAVGTGSTAETAADVALVAEVARSTGTVSHNGTGIYQVVATFGTNSAVGAIYEYGMFSSSSAGTLLARDTEAVVNVSATDTLTVTAQVTVS